jgi:hypothetical protein
VFDDLRCRPVRNDACAHTRKRVQAPEHQAEADSHERDPGDMERARRCRSSHQPNACNLRLEQPGDSDAADK